LELTLYRHCFAIVLPLTKTSEVAATSVVWLYRLSQRASGEHFGYFSQTYDFMLWLLHHTEKIPKSERFRLARRLEDTAF